MKGHKPELAQPSQFCALKRWPSQVSEHRDTFGIVFLEHERLSPLGGESSESPGRSRKQHVRVIGCFRLYLTGPPLHRRCHSLNLTWLNSASVEELRARVQPRFDEGEQTIVDGEFLVNSHEICGR